MKVVQDEGGEGADVRAGSLPRRVVVTGEDGLEERGVLGVGLRVGVVCAGLVFDEGDALFQVAVQVAQGGVVRGVRDGAVECEVQAGLGAVVAAGRGVQFVQGYFINEPEQVVLES